MNVETLESRRLLSVTAAEQYFVYRINYARSDPSRYEAEEGLSVSLAGVSPRQPLAINDALISSSGWKSNDMATLNYFSHTSPSGMTANRLVRDHGFDLPATLPAGGSNWIFPDSGNSVESLAAGYSTVDSALRALIVDAGINPPGHRYHLLGIPNPYAAYREIGVGYSFNSSTTYRHYWSIHAAARNTTQSFLTGVAFDDADGDGRYDMGEGLAGVSVSADGSSTLTNSQGGWSLPVSDGEHLVVASGGAFEGVSQVTVAVAGQNVEVDFVSGEAGAYVDFSLVEPTSTNTDPSAVADQTVAAVNGNAVVHVLLNDSDPDGDNVSLLSFGQGSDGTVTDLGDGALRYSPDAEFQGTDSFTYAITDGNGGTSTATVSVTVTEPLASLVGRNRDTWWVARSSGTSFVNQQWGQWTLDGPLRDARVADVNGDGLDDVVGRFQNQLWVARSDGTQFVQELWGEWSDDGPWEDMNVADVDGDGRYDVVARDGGTWWVARSTGASFVVESWGAWSTSPQWLDVLVADVNGDGRDDIAGRADGKWYVAVSDGGGFTNQLWGTWSAAASWRDVMAGDLNGDGRDDIVGRRNGDWWVALSDGDRFDSQVWGAWSPNASWVDARIADVDGDGRDDIIGRADGGWWVARSDGAQLTNEKWTTWSATASWLDVQVDDFNGDGRDDIVGRSNGTIYVARSTGSGFVTESWGQWAEVAWHDVMTGGFAGDGGEQPGRRPGSLPLVDIAGRADGSWWVAHSTGNDFANVSFSNWSANATWTDVQAADFNGDGLTDIVGRSDGKWYVARSVGGDFVTGLWGRWSKNATWTDVRVGDFNGDGADDIVGRTRNKWWVAVSNGGGFNNQRWGVLHDSITFDDLVVADVDGDGTDDLVGRQSDGNLRVMRSTGTRFVNDIWGAWTPGTWQDVNAADFDGDGRQDLVGRQDGYWWVAISDGTAFDSSVWGQWSTAETWLDVRVSDFDGDGLTDIAARAGGDWWIARSDGTMLIDQLWTQWADVAWDDVLSADFNMDGWDDLAARDPDGNWHVSLSRRDSFAAAAVWGAWSDAVTWEDVLAGEFHAH